MSNGLSTLARSQAAERVWRTSRYGWQTVSARSARLPWINTRSSAALALETNVIQRHGLTPSLAHSFTAFRS